MVAPVLHRCVPEAADDVSVILLPAQKVVGPELFMIGALIVQDFVTVTFVAFTFNV